MWDEENYPQSDSWGDSYRESWQEYQNHEHYGPATSSWRIRNHATAMHPPTHHPYQPPQQQHPGYNRHLANPHQPPFFDGPAVHSNPYVAAQRDRYPPLPFPVPMRQPRQGHPMHMSPPIREMVFRPSESWAPRSAPDSWLHAGKKLYAQSAGFQHILTPHASEEGIALRRESLEEEHRMKKPRLYNDFSEPSRPKSIQLKVETSAIKCAVFWNFPDLTTKIKYKQQIEITEVTDDLAPCESEFLAPHVTNYKFKTVPGRCKPKYYWDEIYMHRDGIMEKYIKDENGQAASPINGEIEGLFFSARTLPDGHLPPSSPFGDMRMHLPAYSLLNPAEINMYFCDYYCNRLTHYVTVVVCKKGSSTDKFCRDRIRPLNVQNNPFLRVEPLDGLEVPYAFFVNKSIWVEIYYTEHVPMRWGKFNAIMATGAGTSRIGGPTRKTGANSNQTIEGSTEMVEDLVATYENNEQDNIFERSSTRYTLLGCVQAELLSPSTPMNASIAKEDFLETLQNLAVFNANKQEELYVPKEQQNTTAKPSEPLFKKPLCKAMLPADANIELEDDEITVITLSDDEDDTTDGQQAKQELNYFSCCDKPAPVETKSVDKSHSLSKYQETSTSLSNPAKMMKILDEIVSPESGQKKGAKSTFSASPLVLSLVNKVKALIKDMNTDFKDINTSLEKAIDKLA